MPARAATRGPEDPVEPGYHVPFAARIRKEAASRPGRSASSPSPSRPRHRSPAGQADCTAHARAFLLDPRWGWNAARALGVETPPLPLPAVRGTTILPFKPQPILAGAAD
jgi:2,4-dienoyl-CoA reductase-like NADH-dependent reductase (Old Yellow Enzyme family)